MPKPSKQRARTKPTQPNATTRKVFAATDAGKGLIRTKNAKDLFAKVMDPSQANSAHKPKAMKSKYDFSKGTQNPYAKRLNNKGAKATKNSAIKETEYLLSIPGMRESILKAKKAPHSSYSQKRPF